MCGIVGLFIKDKALEPELGTLTAAMLSTMCERGPDSAGFAIYGASEPGVAKITLQSADPDRAFANLADRLGAALGCQVALARRSTHAVLTLPAAKVAAARAWLKASDASIRVMGAGEAIEIYKEVGYPTDVAQRFGLESMRGTHAIGHTRMATESDVDIRSAHPYWAYPYSDIAVVHNGQITNYWVMRREMERKGHRFMSSCDSELLAVYVAHYLEKGAKLEDVLKESIKDIDGVFTYLVTTKDAIGMAKDTMAAKPMVLYESDKMVCLASEEMAIRAVLPQEIDTWDPYDEEVRVWRA